MRGRSYSGAKASFILAQKDKTRSWKLQTGTLGVQKATAFYEQL